MPIYFGADIPAQAERGFVGCVALLEGEELEGLYDKTLFGSAKAGIAITNQRVIIYERDRLESIPFSEVVYAYIDTAGPVHQRLNLILEAGDPMALDVFTPEASDLDQFVATIRRHADPMAWEQVSAKLEKPTKGPLGVVHSSRMPLCPHCSNELPHVLERSLDAMLGVRYVYFCPQCRRVLGFSHREGHRLR